MMKKTGLLITTLGLCVLTLTGCNSNCNCEKEVDARLQQAMDFCLEHGGTHSLVHSQTAVYGECMFPSGIGCEDDVVLSGECNYEADTSSIDTEEERLAGCEENVQGYVRDFVEGAEDIDIQWGEESEGGASFVREGIISYTKDGVEQKIKAECVADFVDGSITTHYDEMDESAEEPIEEVAEDVVDETVEEVTEEVAEDVVE